MVKWVDATGYSQRDEKREVRTVEATGYNMRIIVSRWSYGDADTWYLSVNSLIERKALLARNLDEAKDEAIRITRNHVRRILDSLK